MNFVLLFDRVGNDLRKVFDESGVFVLAHPTMHGSVHPGIKTLLIRRK